MGEMPFNSLKTEFLEGKTLQRQHIKTQVENPRMPESGFTLDKTMHLNINFHKLALIPGGSYTELPKWIKAVINPQKKDEQCFQWGCHCSIKSQRDCQRSSTSSKLQTYEDQHNWKGFKFPVSIKNMDKFGKDNPGTTLNVLFNNKESSNKNIYIQPED